MVGSVYAPFSAAQCANSVNPPLCHAIGSGDITDPTKWSCTNGATAPDDGVYAAIDGNFVITIPAGGTYGSAGAGLCTIRTGYQSTLCLRASMGTPGACSTPDFPTTIIFGSTGTNPIGSGSNTNPGSDATMHGFFNSRGNLNLTGNWLVTITSGDGTSPVYFHHEFTDIDTGESTIGPTGTNGTSSHTGNTYATTIKQLYVMPVCGVAGYFGDYGCVYQAGYHAIIDIENNRFDLPGGVNGAIDLSTGPPVSLAIKSNTFIGTTSISTIYADASLAAGCCLIDGNTEMGATSATNNYMIELVNGSMGNTITRNAVWVPAAIHRGLINDNYQVVGDHISYNLGEEDEPSTHAGVYGIRVGSGPTDTTSSIDHNYMRCGVSSMAIAGSDTATPSIQYNILTTYATEVQGQGSIIQAHGRPNYSHNIYTWEEPNMLVNTIAGIKYCATAGMCAFSEDHATYFFPWTMTQASTLLNIGDSGAGPFTISYLHSSTFEGGGTGASALGLFEAPADLNVWLGSGNESFNNGIATVGAHHLIVAPNTKVTQRAGSGGPIVSTPTTVGNFDDHTHAHPDSSYGDVVSFSWFISPYRRAGTAITLATGVQESSFDATQGGCGTYGATCGTSQNLVGNLSLRWCGSHCGNYGVPNYDSRYTIDGPGGIWAWVWAGFQPQNLQLIATDCDTSTNPCTNSSALTGHVAGAVDTIRVKRQNPM